MSRDGYGPLGGFLYAWTWFLIAKPASIATVVTGLVLNSGDVPHFFLFSLHPLSLLRSPSTWGQLVAIAAAILISFPELFYGVKKAGEFPVARLYAAEGGDHPWGSWWCAFSGIGNVAGRGWGNFAGTFAGAKGGTAGFMAALVATLWAYDGWNDLNMVGGEVKQPERNIPIALIAGVATVGVLYVLVNAAVQYVLPAERHSGFASSGLRCRGFDSRSMVGAGNRLGGHGGVFDAEVTLNGTIMSGARVPFAVARDRYFFRALGDVHPRFHTPGTAIVVQGGAVDSALLLLGGNFRQLFSLAIFAEWLFYMIAGSTVFVFRWRDPQAARPYQMWGYPFVPAIFVAVAAALLGYTFWE